LNLFFLTEVQHEDLFRRMINKTAECIEVSHKAVQLAMNPGPLALRRLPLQPSFPFSFSFFFFFLFFSFLSFFSRSSPLHSHPQTSWFLFALSFQKAIIERLKATLTKNLRPTGEVIQNDIRAVILTPVPAALLAWGKTFVQKTRSLFNTEVKKAFDDESLLPLHKHIHISQAVEVLAKREKWAGALRGEETTAVLRKATVRAARRALGAKANKALFAVVRDVVFFNCCFSSRDFQGLTSSAFFHCIP